MADTVKHTPGPWYPGHFGTDSKCQCKSIISDGHYVGAIATVHTDNGKSISEGGNDAPKRGEAVANMHLIAAAPELLEALKLCVDNIQGIADEEDIPSTAIRAKARAAIAKATGGQ